jgi:hypothetical protein
MKIECVFYYCIYNRDFRCVLEKIKINMFGMCDDCTIVAIPEEFLRPLKERQLEKE